MSKNKHVVKGFLLLFVAFFAAIIFSESAFAEAAISFGMYTDASGVRWEWELKNDPDNGDEPQALTIKFYDKPETLTTVKVPSLQTLISAVPGANASLDTYYLRSARTALQDSRFPDETRRTATADTTKLDMSETSKIQILGISPIINPEVETELVFGPNMVIAESTERTYYFTVCGTITKRYGREYCGQSQYYYFVPDAIATADDATYNAYVPTASDIAGMTDCSPFSSTSVHSDLVCYYTGPYGTTSTKGVFSGLKLKLTDFGTFNYLGTSAFENSTFNDANKTIRITGTGFDGSYIFRNTNVTKAIIDTNSIGRGVFMNCAGLTSVQFTDNVTRVSDDAFYGTGLTSIDFTGTNIKDIGPRSFYNAPLASINLGSVEKIEYQAFAKTQIEEIVMPKSINFLEGYIFQDDTKLKKMTINYDTLTSGTTLPLMVVMGDYSYGGYNLEELVINAPYAEGDELSPTHVSYYDYKWKFDMFTPGRRYDDNGIHDRSSGNCYGWINDGAYMGGETCHSGGPTGSTYGSGNFDYWTAEKNKGAQPEFETDYVQIDSMKNVIAPIYFSNLKNLRKIYIGDGYEFIGSSAFISWQQNNGGETWGYILSGNKITLDNWNRNKHQIDELRLPEGLIGIGNLAFEDIWGPNLEFDLPESLEFIGIAAFRRNWLMNNDINLPNLRALGDFAFESTHVKNITLNDKLQYVGTRVFSNCLWLNDITFDFDVFDPDIYVAWALPGRVPGFTQMHFRFSEDFGIYRGTPSAANIEEWGINWVSEDEYNEGWIMRQKYGTIKFTAKNQSEMPNGYPLVYGWYNTPYSESDNGIYNAFMGHMGAEKVDLGETNWRVLEPRMFQDAYIGEVVLPHNLEVIGGAAFNNAAIMNELVIPDTVVAIGDNAFENHYNDSYWGGDKSFKTVKITALPSSLIYVGRWAFYNDRRMTGDLNAPNLQYIGNGAFNGSDIHDILLPNGLKALHSSTFARSNNINNITIDCDFGKLKWNGEPTAQELEGWTDGFLAFADNNLDKLAATLKHGVSNEGQDDQWKFGYEPKTFYNYFANAWRSDECDYSNGSCRVLAYGQDLADLHFGKVTFTENAKADIAADLTDNYLRQSWQYPFNRDGYFAGMTFEEVDMGAAQFKNIADGKYIFSGSTIGKLTLPATLESIPEGAFFEATINEPVALPDSVSKIGRVAFQWANVTLNNSLPDTVTDIDDGAFYGTDVTDELVIPETVTHIGFSAFNAGDRDVHYDKVTIKPALIFENTEDQLVHQFMWSSDVDEMVINSSNLPALAADVERGYQEFWSMPFDKVTITDLPGISWGAFENCTNLEEVDASEDSALRLIRDEAFLNATSLHIFDFSPAIKDETVVVGQHAFKGTAFKTMGKPTDEFNLRAAKFDASAGLAFSGMPKLEKVDVPNSFSNGTIPEATFHNDGELKEASVDYKISLMDNAAFSNDNKLERIFIWGNTVVRDEQLPDYPADGGRGGDGDEEDYGITIPEGTDIYAYSTSPTENYAGFDGREDFEGTFYPLDEVIYLTSNKTHVRVNDEETDFDKSGMIVYGMRRDGVVLESKRWSEFDGTAYPRSEKELSFEKMVPTIMEDPAFGTVWDTPVPMNELSLANENFANIDFALIRDSEDENVRLVDIVYTDLYTEGEPDTDVLPYFGGGSDPDVPGPLTFAENIAGYVAVFASLSAVAFFIVRQRRR